MSKLGVVLANLGTPRDPSSKEVGAYLREFLSDPCVIDVPQPWRWMLVNLAIVPFRSGSSAKMYQEIWTEQGSPLLIYSRRLEARLQGLLPPRDYDLRLAMRYGKPSMEQVMGEMWRDGIRRFLVSPQYPQFALSTYESTVREARRVLDALDPRAELLALPPFYDDDRFLDVYGGHIRDSLRRTPADHVVMSFHGVPVRHITKEGFGGPRCFQDDDCCSRISEDNRNCYRAQCLATARALARRAGLAPEGYTVAFQSRIKGSKWIDPYTDEVILDLAAKGINRLSVACPAFTVDCLETLEEVASRYGADFRKAGGEKLTLIPCLNDLPAWADALSGMIQSFAGARAAAAAAR